MRFLDLFAGIGGFRSGFEQAGHKCVGYVECDKHARRSYEAMYDTTGEWRATDIRAVEPADLPEADIYTAGFPCSSFSIAGKQRGFEDARGTLFFEVMRLAKERRPKYIVIENVRGLLSHDRGRTFQIILETMDDLRFDAEWQVIDSRSYTPQHRERVYLIGHSRDACTRQVFPIARESCDAVRATRTEAIVGGEPEPICWGSLQAHAAVTTDGISPTLTEAMGMGGGQVPCITAGMRIRKLLPIECWRLQGFSDDLFHRAAAVNSDTQLYKQAGNSCTVPVLYEIARRIEP